MNKANQWNKLQREMQLAIVVEIREYTNPILTQVSEAERAKNVTQDDWRLFADERLRERDTYANRGQQ